MRKKKRFTFERRKCTPFFYSESPPYPTLRVTSKWGRPWSGRDRDTSSRHSRNVHVLYVLSSLLRAMYSEYVRASKQGNKSAPKFLLLFIPQIYVCMYIQTVCIINVHLLGVCMEKVLYEIYVQLRRKGFVRDIRTIALSQCMCFPCCLSLRVRSNFFII